MLLLRILLDLAFITLISVLALELAVRNEPGGWKFRFKILVQGLFLSAIFFADAFWYLRFAAPGRGMEPVHATVYAFLLVFKFGLGTVLGIRAFNRLRQYLKNRLRYRRKLVVA